MARTREREDDEKVGGKIREREEQGLSGEAILDGPIEGVVHVCWVEKNVEG